MRVERLGVQPGEELDALTLPLSTRTPAPPLEAEMPAFAIKLFSPAQYKVFYGGRGGGRSWSFARALLIMGAKTKLRILCCREFQKSLEDSVHKLLTDQITLLNLPAWKVNQKTIEHRVTGTTFQFEGLRYNANRIKSFEGIDICWVEEAEAVTHESWRILIPTIRKAGSEIWISFNPYLESDPTYQRFVINKPPNCVVIKTGWEDNPWFPKRLQSEKDYLYKVDAEEADHVWGGTPWKASAAQIMRDKWDIEPFTPQHEWLGPYFGLDFGFSENPNAMVECYIRRMMKKPKRVENTILYINRESWHLRLDIHKMLPVLKKDLGNSVGRRVVRADAARPETISYLKQHGMPRIIAAKKWNGSIEDGIEYMRQFERIVIHPRCKHMQDEAKAYSFKVDEQTNEVTKRIIDKHNDLWDAVRYALQPHIRARKKGSRYAGTNYSAA